MSGLPASNQLVQVVDHELAHGVPGVDRGGADMGEKHDIVEREQRLRHVRLVGEDVEAGGADRAGRERLDQRRIVDHRAAADIDQDAVRPERLEHAGIDRALRRRRAGEDDHQRVDRLGHGVKVGDSSGRAGRAVRCRAW